MAWKSKRIGGVTYDLSHLDTKIVSVTPHVLNAPTYRVLVSYGCHTFTRELDANDIPDLHYINGGETRCFCVDRYKLSLSLPKMVNAAAQGGRAYFGQGSNMLILDNTHGAAGPYCVFFKMTKSTKSRADAVMFVVSAYLKPALPKKLGAISFAALVGTVANGHKVRNPGTRIAY